MSMYFFLPGLGYGIMSLYTVRSLTVWIEILYCLHVYSVEYCLQVYSVE
jgi:hypothetical protein